jgi:hypothetical protein
MIPAKTDAQNATVNAINGTEAAMVAGGCLPRTELPPRPEHAAYAAWGLAAIT